MAWLRGKNALAQKPKVPLYPKDLLRMLCGAPITRANSCWGIKDTVIRLPSPTMPAVISCSAKPWSPSRNRVPLPPFERLFQERGLPQAIRSDNGVPFASPNGLFNLSKLAVWWLRLGITIQRIQPGHPQQNGRHERTDPTLKDGSYPAGRLQLPSTTSQVRCLRSRV